MITSINESLHVFHPAKESVSVSISIVSQVFTRFHRALTNISLLSCMKRRSGISTQQISSFWNRLIPSTRWTSTFKLHILLMCEAEYIFRYFHALVVFSMEINGPQILISLFDAKKIQNIPKLTGLLNSKIQSSGCAAEKRLISNLRLHLRRDARISSFSAVKILLSYFIPI